MPAFRFNMVTEITVHENHPGIGPPGSPKVIGFFSYIFGSNNTAVNKHIAKLLFLRGGGGRHITSPFFLTENLTILENGCGSSENEIRGSFDIAIFVILAAFIAMGV